MTVIYQFVPASYTDSVFDWIPFWNWEYPENSERLWELAGHSRGPQTPLYTEDIHRCEDCQNWYDWYDCYCCCNDLSSDPHMKIHISTYDPHMKRSRQNISRINYCPLNCPLNNDDVIVIDDTESTKGALKVPKLDISDEQVCERSDTDGKKRLRSSVIDGVSKPTNYHVIDVDSETEINETSSYTVYKYLKEFLKQSGRQIDAMKGDGNCFFRALSKIIYGNQRYYDEIRQAVVDVIRKHPMKFEAFTDGPVSQHIKHMRPDKMWATQTEIYAAATLLNRDIYVLSPEYENGDRYRWLLFKPQFPYLKKLTGCKCYITICHTHGNHYDRIAAVSGKCNCFLSPPKLCGVKGKVDLTCNDDEIF